MKVWTRMMATKIESRISVAWKWMRRVWGEREEAKKTGATRREQEEEKEDLILVLFGFEVQRLSQIVQRGMFFHILL